MSALEVLAAGPLALIEDLGRPGNGHLGVSPSGAMDRAALRLGNRLVGNPEDAAGLEILLGGARFRSLGSSWVAVTGAWGDVRVDGRPVAVDRPVQLPNGATIELPPADRGLRYYVALRGGIDVEPVLGSRSTDTMSGLGPAPIRTGDVLEAGAAPSDPVPPTDEGFTGPPPPGLIRLALRPGPRADWFTPEAWATLFTAEWRASQLSDRVGIRLEGTPLERRRGAELPSEGMVAGALQVPPSGLPTILVADHPVTGGYPVIAVVVDRDLDALAQLAPGQPVAFTLAAGRG